MTNSDSQFPSAAAGTAQQLRPDARLIGLHAERGDAHARLETALAALEGADWGLTLAGEAALGQQLRALLGAGVLRLDPRLPLRRDLLAEAGLAAAGLEGDWRGAVAVWLLEPNEADLARAARAEVPVIVDATLAPGGHWLAAGAQYVTYHHGAALTGFAEGELALLCGSGERPAAAAAAAADLTVALALRDAATLPLRLARAAQTAAALAEQWQGRALPVGPTALLLPPEAAAATAAPLGGVLPAARPVQGGVLLTPGLAQLAQVRALLRDEPAPVEDVAGPVPAELPEEEAEFAPAPVPAEPLREDRGPRTERFGGPRDSRREDRREGHPRRDRETASAQPTERQSQAEPAPTLERFVFEAPAQPQPLAAEASAELPEASTQASPEATPEAAEVQSVLTENAENTDLAEPDTLRPDLPVEQLGSGRPDPAAELTEEQSAIFARLRDWRNAEASRQEISRFIVASNATLAEIARRVPYTLDDLRSIKGMGPARLSKYGEAIVQVVRGQRR